MNRIIKIAILAVVMLNGIQTFATPNGYEFSVDGITYFKSEHSEGLEMTCTDELLETCRINGIKEVVIPESVIDPYGNELPVTDAFKCFLNDDNIERIILPSGMESIYACFSQCSALKYVDLGKSLTYIFGSFSKLPNIREVSFPETLKDIVVESFLDCGFEELEIPASVTIIDEYSFLGMPNLKKLTFKGPKLGIGQYCFCIMPLIETLDFSEVSDITADPWCFSMMSSLKEIWLPKTDVRPINPIKWFDSCGFSNCRNLSAIYNPNPDPSGYSGNYEGYGYELQCTFNKADIVLYVPTGCVDAYKADEEWSKFPNILEYEFESASSVEISTDSHHCTRYFNLQGIEVENPTNGIFIEVNGQHSRKIRL
ncbi:MAG: leucine-rich repeat domain-containing protein [Muribaculaceae bacterium]|nr:leucine-rich repeat domain-containing protein [Muribaculaceae bacterium]